MNYVLGFMFNDALDRVALIRKAKPEWQRGLLNGIGGKIEEDEEPVSAMVREFQEETGQCHEAWLPYCQMTGERFNVYCFCAKGPLERLKTNTEEPVVIVEVEDLPRDTIENLTWLIAMAIDHLVDGRPAHALVAYYG